jgi:hypothetical protein
MNRQQAIVLKSYKYFTGRPCNRGHLAHRYTKTGACSACTGVYQAAYDRKIRKKILGASEYKRVSIEAHIGDVDDIKRYASARRIARELQAATN